MQTLILSVYFSQVDARSKHYLIETEDNKDDTAGERFDTPTLNRRGYGGGGYGGGHGGGGYGGIIHQRFLFIFSRSHLGSCWNKSYLRALPYPFQTECKKSSESASYPIQTECIKRSNLKRTKTLN